MSFQDCEASRWETSKVYDGLDTVHYSGKLCEDSTSISDLSSEVSCCARRNS